MNFNPYNIVQLYIIIIKIRKDLFIVNFKQIRYSNILAPIQVLKNTEKYRKVTIDDGDQL